MPDSEFGSLLAELDSVFRRMLTVTDSVGIEVAVTLFLRDGEIGVIEAAPFRRTWTRPVYTISRDV